MALSGTRTMVTRESGFPWRMERRSVPRRWLTSQPRRYLGFGARPQQAVENAGDRSNGEDCEPRNDTNNRNRDDRYGPRRQTVHGAFVPRRTDRSSFPRTRLLDRLQPASRP